MKLLSCHVENYGKLTDRDFAFHPGINAFEEENGYGKSTLASFLKAMFYGLDSDRSNSLFNERRHYFPFAGGRFGGAVTFEYGGAEYRVERFFDEKSENRDELNVYRNGVPSDEFGGAVGEKVFGIDKLSFERTAFVSGGDAEVAMTGSIGEKLNAFARGDDDAGFDRAADALEKAEKEYRRARGGKIAADAAEVAELRKRVIAAEQIAGGLPAKYERLKEIDRKIDLTREALGKAHRDELLQKDWERHDDAEKRAAEAEDGASALERKYPSGLPTDKEFDELRELYGTLRGEKARLGQKIFTEADERELAALETEFRAGLPSEEDAARAEESVREVARLSALAEPRGEEVGTDDERRLRLRFSEHYPDDGEIAELEERAAACESSKRAAPRTGLAAGLVAAGAAGLAGGIAAAFLWNAIAAVLAFLGAVVLGVGAFVLARGRRGAGGGNAEEEMRAAVDRYGYTLEGGARAAVEALKRDRAEYLRLLSSDAERKERANRLREKTAELDAFFLRFGISGGDMTTRLARLGGDAKNLARLRARKKQSDENDAAHGLAIRDAGKRISAICRRYALNEEDAEERLDALRKDASDLASYRDAAKRGREEAEKIARERGLSERPAAAGEEQGSDEIRAEQSALAEAKARLVGEIANDEADAEKLDALRADYDKACEKQQEDRKTGELLAAALRLLREADGRIKDRYLRPIRERFRRYSDVLSRALGEKIAMGADFRLRFEANGKERSEEHMSSGERSVLSLCLRLALIDNMYPSEKPFLVFDDPFAALDERHFGKVREVADDIAGDRQILYFTCHPSRALGRPAAEKRAESYGGAE